MVRISKFSLLIYLFFIVMVISKISSSGITIMSGFKFSPGDIMIIVSFLFILLNKPREFKEVFNRMEIKIYFLFLLFVLIMLPIGLLNGNNIPVAIRTIRNLLYFPFSAIVFYVYFRVSGIKSIMRTISFISFLVIINALIGISELYVSTGWYGFFRENGLLTVYLFLFLFYYINNFKKIISSILTLIPLIILLLISFFSQERTQLLVIIVVILFNFLITLSRKDLINKINPKKVFKGSILFISISISIFLLLKIDFIANYINYFTQYRIGFLFNNASVMDTGSMMGRSSQLKTIVLENTNIFNFFIGNGLDSYYNNELFNTYVVDSTLLWSYKDFGIIGLFLIFILFFNMLKLAKRVKSNFNNSIFSGTLSIVIMSAFVPSIFGNPSAGFLFGYALAVIYYALWADKNENRIY